MPIYNVKCNDCNVIIELILKFSQIEENDTVKDVVCPVCGKEHLTKLPSLDGGSFHLKGKGWYKDGY